MSEYTELIEGVLNVPMKMDISRRGGGSSFNVPGVETCEKCAVVGVGTRCWRFRGDNHFYSMLPDLGLPPTKRRGTFEDCDAFKAIQPGMHKGEAREVATILSVQIVRKSPMGVR